MLIRCIEDTTSIYINFNDFMSELNGGGIVTYRIDDGPAAQITMERSNNYEALGLWRGATAIPFIRRLVGATTLFVRATPYGESRREFYFPIAGLAEALVPLQAACHWR